MKRLLFTLAVLGLACSPVLGQNDVTLNNDLEWDESVGAAGYQAKMQTSVNAPFWPSNTDGNVVHDNGLATTFDLALALTGAAPGSYKFLVRAVDVGGTNPTLFTTLTVNFLGIAAPGNIRVVALKPPANIQIAFRQFAELVRVAARVAA